MAQSEVSNTRLVWELGESHLSIELIASTGGVHGAEEVDIGVLLADSHLDHAAKRREELAQLSLARAHRKPAHSQAREQLRRGRDDGAQAAAPAKRQCFSASAAARAGESADGAQCIRPVVQVDEAVGPVRSFR